MTSAAEFRPADWQARDQALDPRRSFIVQAPAGSGKTELLIQRILTLLGQVERPEDILAITFTRKAAREMQQRLLDALLEASRGDAPGGPHQQTTRRLADRALEQDRRLGWKLPENPTRLKILTIDSLCTALVRRMPWLSRFGSPPEIAEDATPHYRRAAERIVERIRRNGPGADEVAVLLRHLDNRMEVLRDLLADMLGRRDQWLRHLLDREQDEARQILEQGLRSFIAAQLRSVAGRLTQSLQAELAEPLAFAARNLQAQDGLQLPWFLRQRSFPPPEPGALTDWQALADLLLTKSGTPRKRATRNQGFPPGGGATDQRMKQAFERQLEELAGLPDVCLLLHRTRELPRPRYTGSEWQLIEALVRLLPLTVVELDAVFREQGETDFIAVAGAARAALGESDAPEELLLQIDNRLRHILVDEFQDTSYGQYVLLQQLTSGWEPDDGRSLFVVGDPMQSIYRFREAEVGLFLRARRSGLAAVELEPLQLTANFRSHRGLVDWFNRSFARLFPAVEDEARGAVSFAPAVAAREAAGEPFLQFRVLPERHDRTEAGQVLDAVRQARSEDPRRSIGILVRSRAHAGDIVTALEGAGIRYQARDIVQLKNRAIIQDLLALTRTLLHRGDRVAWLSVLRAPWCGLPLDALLDLVGDEPKTAVIDLLLAPERQPDLFRPLAPERQERLQQVAGVLDAGLAKRGRVSLQTPVESTWLALGGPACCEAAELVDAGQYFRLLERLDRGGDLERLGDLDAALDGLFAAPDPLADDRLQIMTIHKAKGLEFDAVIVPGLGRSVRGRDKALLRWLEHPDHELLLAPIPAADGSGEGATYAAIGKLLKEKEDLELIRLLYVAVTRARHSLVLLGHLQEKADGTLQAPSGSLLAAGWEVLEGELTAAAGDLPATAEDDPAPECRRLRRLPGAWQLPDWPPAPDYFLQHAQFASRPTETEELAVSHSRSTEARIVGETVHNWFERHAGRPEIAADGKLPAQLARQLVAHGIPQARLEKCLDKTLKCIRNAVSGERGSWVLRAHREQAAELALTGVLNRQLVQARIDRTFVDEDNVRWVIDYKTAVPESGQELADFYRQQLDLYAPQLQTYRALMLHLEPQREVRAALYFPAFDGWRELAHE